MTIEVIKPGLLTTLQDSGRRGLAHLGVGRSGAFDSPALRIANALCGNPQDACGLEITLLGPTLRFHANAWIAVTGAPLAITIDGVDAPVWAPLPLRAGATVVFGAIRTGCRSYLAIHGGFDVPPVLGSRSTDVNSALGPLDGRALRAGDELPFAAADAGGPCGAPHWWLDPRPWFDDDPHRCLRLVHGSHFEQLAGTSCKELFLQPFKVHADSNRVGLRLAGPKLEWTVPIEMLSEGCVSGLLQLPPSGQPIAFGPECPVSGGYPRIGQIAAADIPLLAQRRPGDEVRFKPCTLDDALHALRDRERALARVAATIRQRLNMDSGFLRDNVTTAPE